MNADKSDMVEPTNITAICEAHYNFLSLWPGSLREDGGGAVMIGNRLVPIPFRSHVALVRSQSEDIPALIERANVFYQAIAAAPAFQLDPETIPADLPQRLL